MIKKVQIPTMLFYQMVLYIMDHEDANDRMYKTIMGGVDRKIASLQRHNLYTMYKCADNPQEREQARQEYLDSAGILPSFRWEEYPSSNGKQR